jgi:predicted nucleic acid-binding protein
VIANATWISKGVVDASVAAKWLLPDQRSARADQVLEAVLGSDAGSFVVPEVFFGEVTSSLGKRLDEHRDVVHGLATVSKMPFERVAWESTPHRLVADLVLQRVGAYDAVYVAVALDRRLPLLTSDRRLARALREPSWVILIE